MTFVDVAAQSKTMTRAWGDLVDGYRRRELWLHLGWQDIKQRYRRSVLGPFWITIATGTTAVAMGGLYSKLFHLQLSVHLPYVTLGLIIWNLINASILEGADVFVANEGLIKQLPTPLSVHVYRLVWRQMILFAHNIVIYVVIAIIFPKQWSWADLSVIPALGLIVLNCVWVSLCFGILSTRFRDIGPLLFSIVQLLFFMTPIIWNLINASILEGADVFVANEGLIKQLPTPLSVHVYRLVWRQMILFAHNIVIYLVIAIIFPKQWSWADLAVIPALGLIVLNCVWVSLCFGILSTRFRDIGPLLFSIVQLLFFMTPIIWNDDTLRQQGAGQWSKIVELNPLLHYLDIVRAPLLGSHQELRHWAVVIGLTIVGWVVAAFAMRQYRARVAYWV